jgi:hypothetical protein
MSSLQIALIIAGVLLVAGVIAYNGWQERRYRSHLAEVGASEPASVNAHAGERVEPTLYTAAPRPANSNEDADTEAAASVTPTATPLIAAAATSGAGIGAAAPDAEIECIIALQPVQPVTAGALGAGLHARLGKPLRWFGSNGEGAWRQLANDTPGRYTEVAACLLLADRNGAASTAQIEAFSRVVGEIAPTLPAAFVPPDVQREAERAETLDRLCADLDVQIGLTVQKSEPGAIPGTRLRGVAEAAGFHLAPGGRFEWASEDSDAVMYSLQNLRAEPFTADSLRLTGTHGVVFLLDVARVTAPARAFDQMKLAAKRMATTLDGALVDDNGRALDDDALALIREQVQAASDALSSVHIDPGSARALALFGA